MKDEISPTERSFFEEGLEKLSSIESIQEVYWGPPAMTPREVVDNSYDYAFVVHFKNVQAHDAYQVDKLHLDFIEASKHLWEDVQVYDNLVED
ncbi:MAG: Dabb family protein [Saprospiraceae bacterium]|nr:Dabb family protein [Saprospiraceae bacterium]